MNIYNHILQAKADGQKLLAVLIDPDKFELKNALQFIKKVNASIITHIFVMRCTAVSFPDSIKI